MKLNISYKHLEPLPSIQERIEQKVEHLKKYFHGSMNVNWVCSIDNGMQKSEVHIHAAHNDFYAHAESRNLYKTFDTVIEKLEAQLQKRDNQIKNKIHQKRMAPVVESEGDYEQADERGEFQ